jgi:crotonobetainyl-CoA:carnitine CoA-transferase CaiB-like acyl-CoA transferase
MTEIKPLEGIRILDFTRLLPGPLGTHLLSEMGAEITKIESPKRLDYVRFYPPIMDGNSVLFHLLNVDKNCLFINYETKDGLAQIKEKIATSDVLIEQFRPGTMAGFGLSFEDVKNINPDIVYISVTGYGQTGEYRDKAGHDLNYMALSGLLDLNKDEHGKPVVPGFQVADIAGGSYMLLSAVTSGLLAQHRTKKAQYIDLALLDAVMPMGAVAHGMEQGGASYKKTPILSGFLVNYNVYECQDKKWIALGALELKFWNTFCNMIQKPEWIAQNDSELINGVFDKSKLDKLFSEKNREEWLTLAEDYDICLTPVLSVEEANKQANMISRKVFREAFVGGKTIQIYSQPFKTFCD